jgi:hypothetical protein
MRRAYLEALWPRRYVRDRGQKTRPTARRSVLGDRPIITLIISVGVPRSVYFVPVNRPPGGSPWSQVRFLGTGFTHAVLALQPVENLYKPHFSATHPTTLQRTLIPPRYPSTSCATRTLNNHPRLRRLWCQSWTRPSTVREHYLINPVLLAHAVPSETVDVIRDQG